MIEKMKKLTFLVYHREYEDFLHRLQDLGVMHVVTSEVNPQQSEAISGYVEQIKQLTALQKDMNDLLATTKDLKVSKDSKDFKSLNALLPLTSRFEHLVALRQQEAEQQSQLIKLEPWGDFDPERVQNEMKAAGCELQFYTASTKTFKKEIEKPLNAYI